MYLANGWPGGAPAGLQAEQWPRIRVSGEGRVEATPDTALLSLGVSARADRAESAYEEAAAALTRIVAALLAAGIPREQLQTEQVSLQPVYDEQKLVGYEGTAGVQVTLRDLAAVGVALDRAVTAGANQVRGVRFELREPGPYELAAWNLAAQEAQRTADWLTRAFGVGLGPIWRVEAEPAPGPIVPLMQRAALGTAAGIPILPGTLTLTRRLTAEYLIHWR